jgi:Uma2 family endonuclease
MATTVEQITIETRGGVVMNDVSWAAFLGMLPALESQRGLRWTYDRGDLEIVNTSRLHEKFKKMLGRLLEVIAHEFDIPLECGGQMTFLRADLTQGLEPDECDWIQHEPEVRGRMQLDFTVDPPPDLAIEIDVSRSSVPRHPVYAALGVPELWRFNGQTLTVLHRRESGEYEVAESSLALPSLPVAELVPFILPDEQHSATARVKECIAWLRERGFRYERGPGE